MTSSALKGESDRLDASLRYRAALESYPKPSAQTDLLYDPSTLDSRAVVPSVTDTTTSPLQANRTTLGAHSLMMSKVELEQIKLQDKDKSFQGHSSEDIANAIQKYAKTHKGSGIPVNFKVNSTSSTASKVTSYAAGGAALSELASTSTVALSPGAYSWAAILVEEQWARVLYCIVWIVIGLLLVFYGYASLFWFNRAGSGLRERLGRGRKAGQVEATTGSARSKRARKQKRRPFLSGGLGGVLVGFLFFSYLASVINNALCADDGKKALGAGAYFAVWLAPGLLGAVLGGHFFFMAKIMAGVLGATCLTITFTAMFGIEAILVRVVLLAILAPLLSAPLLLPRINPLQTLILNGCTSLIGVVTFLNGVALFAAPYDASSNWIDLWTLLFCQDGAASHAVIIGSWGTSAFKGYIAGAVLGAVVGFVFELFLHGQSGKDADSEWNEYLGTYTERFSLDGNDLEGKSGLNVNNPVSVAARVGLFEPAPSAWQRMVDFFDSEAKRPAHWGGLSGDGTLVESISDKIKKKRPSRSAKTAGGVPAKFEVLSKRDDFDRESSSDDDDDDDDDDSDDDGATDIGSEDEEGKALSPTIRMIKNSSSGSDGGGKIGSYAGHTRPSMDSPAPSYNTSQFSGTTAKESSQDSIIHKSVQVYRDAAVSPPIGKSPSPLSPTQSPQQQPRQQQPVQPAAAAAAVPATPSLINAISRIQLAQQAARAWQDEHERNQESAPYKPS
ncbi:hypothetical protein CBS101457_005719 [Exobasidium rhododendri]|nr:hypothetical protein CBS101457_005719 [Exobasidium rhododendri]